MKDDFKDWFKRSYKIKEQREIEVLIEERKQNSTKLNKIEEELYELRSRVERLEDIIIRDIGRRSGDCW